MKLRELLDKMYELAKIIVRDYNSSNTIFIGNIKELKDLNKELYNDINNSYVKEIYVIEDKGLTIEISYYL